MFLEQPGYTGSVKYKVIVVWGPSEKRLSHGPKGNVFTMPYSMITNIITTTSEERIVQIFLKYTISEVPSQDQSPIYSGFMTCAQEFLI